MSVGTPMKPRPFKTRVLPEADRHEFPPRQTFILEGLKAAGLWAGNGAQP
jgi:hypothetical protein